MDEKEKLQAEATALGIDVDGRWGETRLQQEIERAQAHDQAKEKEQDAYGNDASDAGEHPGEDEGGTGAGHEPAGDRGDDAGADDAGTARGGDEGEAVGDGQENPAPAGGADLPAGGDAGGETAGGDAPPIAAEQANGADDDAARGDGGSDPASPPDSAGEPAGADGDPAAQGLADLAAGDADPADQPADAGGGAQGPGDGTPEEEQPDAAALNGETDALGGLPPDLPSMDDAAQREAFEVARSALTGPVIGAFNAACSVAGGGGRSEGWFANEAMVGDYLPALVGDAVPFVREWPTAPVEALYEHVRRVAPVLGHDEPFGELRYTRRLAWAVFRDVLVMADAAVDEEMKRREAAEASDRWGQRDVDPDDTLYAPSTSREQRSDLGRAREGSGALS